MANLGNTIINGILRVNGKINAGDSITAPSFIGDLAGNAATATKANQLTTARTINGTSFNGTANITTANWGTARTIKIGNSGKSVNGSANVTWTLAEIGAAASSHTHSYLPLAGGTMTGTINSSKTTGSYLAGSQGNAVINSTASSGACTTLIKSNSSNGKFTVNTYQSNLIIGYMSNAVIEAGTSSLTESWYFAEDGTLRPRN